MNVAKVDLFRRPLLSAAIVADAHVGLLAVVGLLERVVVGAALWR